MMGHLRFAELLKQLTLCFCTYPIQRVGFCFDEYAVKMCLKEKAKFLNLAFSEFGSPTWARTRDLRINSPSLYRLSYRGRSAYYSV